MVYIFDIRDQIAICILDFLSDPCGRDILFPVVTLSSMDRWIGPNPDRGRQQRPLAHPLQRRRFAHVSHTHPRPAVVSARPV